MQTRIRANDDEGIRGAGLVPYEIRLGSTSNIAVLVGDKEEVRMNSLNDD